MSGARGLGRRGFLGGCGLTMLAAACQSAERESGDAGASGGSMAPAPVARVDTTDDWIDLIAQRPSAVSMRDGRVVVDMGRPQARTHLELTRQSPWMLAQEVEGRRAALLRGRTGTLQLPLDGPLSPKLHPDVEEVPQLALAVEMRALAPDQMATVLLDEVPLVNLRVAEKWERRTLSLPQDRIRPGDNRLRLHFRHLGRVGEESVAAAVERVEVGARELIVAGPATTDAYSVEPRRSGSVAIQLPAGTSLVYYLLLPRRARLRVDVRGRGGLEILASTDTDHREGRPPRSVFQSPVPPDGLHREVDLSGYAGVPVRIELRVGGSGPEAALTLDTLQVIARRPIPVDRRPREARDVYVLAVEGARFDDVMAPIDSASPERTSLPNLARIGKRALVFERAYALGAAAVPSHAGLLSSVVPPAHLTVRGTFVAEGRTMLPEVLDRAGYFGIGVSANRDVGGARGLVQGLDDHLSLERGPTKTGNIASAVMDRVLEQVGQRPRPRFVYATFNDPQAPYDPPEKLRGDLSSWQPEGAPPPHMSHIWVGKVKQGKLVPEPAELAYMRRLYRAEIQSVDVAIGRLLEALAARGELNDAILVVMGVHGEEFLERGGAGHGRTLYDESIRVPLIIHAPALFAAGRVRAPVDMLDLAPTLTDLIGVAPPDEWQGESLVSLLDDPQPPPRLAVSHLGDGSRAAIVGRYKLVLGPGVGPAAERFHDLTEDPGELHDRSAEGGIAIRMVRTALAWHLEHEERWKRARWGTGANLRPAFAMDHGM